MDSEANKPADDRVRAITSQRHEMRVQSWGQHLIAWLIAALPGEPGPRTMEQVYKGGGDENVGSDIGGEPKLNHDCLNGHFCPSGGPNSPSL